MGSGTVAPLHLDVVIRTGVVQDKTCAKIGSMSAVANSGAARETDRFRKLYQLLAALSRASALEDVYQAALTSLLDADRHPATVLVDLYHRRWEQEGVFREIKSALEDRVTQVRAQDPLRAMQEIDGLLLGHFVIRSVILGVAREKGIAPVEISFTGTLRILRTQLAGAPSGTKERKRWWKKVKDAIGKERLQKRRDRSCPRKKKVTRAAWSVKKKGDEEHFIPKLIVLRQSIP